MNLPKINLGRATELVKLGKLGLEVKKHSPELLMAAGVVGFIGTIVLASKATLKVVDETIPDHKANLEYAKLALEEHDKKGDDAYTVKEYNQDRMNIIATTALHTTKAYTPAVVVGVGTLACFFGAYHVLQTRNAALVAAYSLVHTAFGEYRGRVRTELGDAYDQHFRYGIPLKKEIVTITDEDGKKKKVEQVILDPEFDHSLLPKASQYARVFCKHEFDPETGEFEGSTMFANNHELNYFLLQNAQNRMNDRLRVSSYVFLNDVYEYLGLSRTTAGQIVGWIYKGESDQGIRFMDTVDLVSYQNGDPILLDFNVQGPILNTFVERT